MFAPWRVVDINTIGKICLIIKGKCDKNQKRKNIASSGLAAYSGQVMNARPIKVATTLPRGKKSGHFNAYRQAHNLKVTGSNPVPATNFIPFYPNHRNRLWGFFRVQHPRQPTQNHATQCVFVATALPRPSGMTTAQKTKRGCNVAATAAKLPLETPDLPRSLTMMTPHDFREWRARMGKLTIEKTAQLLGCSYGSVKGYSDGRRVIPEYIKKLCVTLESERARKELDMVRKKAPEKSKPASENTANVEAVQTDDAPVNVAALLATAYRQVRARKAPAIALSLNLQVLEADMAEALETIAQNGVALYVETETENHQTAG